jgi:hypothetical protein
VVSFLVSTLTNDAGLPDRIYGKHGTMELGGEPSLRWNGDFKEEFKAKNEGQEEGRLRIKQRRDLEATSSTCFAEKTSSPATLTLVAPRWLPSKWR